MDWGIGNYKQIAVELLPGAQAAIEIADPRAGEHVVDVGCGTGNAALLAAARGARVTGVDSAPRLLEIAAADATARGLDATFLPGEAASLPLPDASADIVVSVFGVIFAPDAPAAAGMARIASDTGRIVLCAWIPGGALFEVIRMRREALAAATNAPPGPPPFAWHEQGALEELFGPLGFDVELAPRRLAFTAGSAHEFFQSELHDHPMWIGARALLEPRGEMDALSARALEIYAAANEDPDGFRLTSEYVVAGMSRSQ
jgi:SAM-dependent methyltransferase